MNGVFEQRNNQAAKLTAGQVLEMRELYARGGISQGKLSKVFGVSVVQVGRIVRGEVWQKLGPAHATQLDIEKSAQKMLAIQEDIGRERLRAEVARARVADVLLGELKAETPAVPLNPLDE